MPFSKAREKVKHGLSRIGGKLGRGGTNAGDKGSNRSALSLQSGPTSIMVEGEVRGGDSKTGGGGNLVPRSMVEGGHDPEETSQSDLLPLVGVEGGSGREGGDRADAPRSDVGKRTPAHSVSRGGKSEGM